MGRSMPPCRSALLFARLEAVEEELHALRKRCDAGSLSERDLACRVDHLLPHDRDHPMPFGGAATGCQTEHYHNLLHLVT